MCIRNTSSSCTSAWFLSEKHKLTCSNKTRAHILPHSSCVAALLYSTLRCCALVYYEEDRTRSLERCGGTARVATSNRSLPFFPTPRPRGAGEMRSMTWQTRVLMCMSDTRVLLVQLVGGETVTFTNTPASDHQQLRPRRSLPTKLHLQGRSQGSALKHAYTAVATAG